MTMIDRSLLSRSLHQALDRLTHDAALPPKLPWAFGVTVKNLADTGTHHDRFNDGKFRVDFDGESWIFDGRVDELGADVSWTAAIHAPSGEVMAQPKMLTLLSSGRAVPQASLGIGSRSIGSLGPLRQIFPAAMTDLLRKYGLPNPYGPVDEVRLDLALIAELCKEAAST